MFKKFLTSFLLTLVAVGGFLWMPVNHGNPVQWEVSWIVSIWVEYTYAADWWQTVIMTNWTEVDVSTSAGTASTTQNAEIQKMLNTLVAAINIILNILTIMVSPAIMLASWLMSPDWTSGDLFGIRPVMHSLWVTVSNITYLIYAILLIFIALATIFNSEHYGYKAMLPKLALGIILVPLTWWAVQFTISLATYVTAAAVSVPAEALKKYTNDSSWWNTSFIPREMIYKNGDTQWSDGSKLSDKATIDAYCQTTGGWKWDDVKCISPSKITEQAGGLFSPLLIYSYWIFKIQDVQKLTTKTDLVKTIISIINQWIIGALMFLVFGILVLALIFMLMMRAIKLWLYAIFSPLFTIKFVLWEKAFWDADKDGSFNISEFIGLAFVPAVVSLALSFWLIIIAGLMSPSNANNPDNKCEGTKCTITLMGIPANTIVSDVKENISTTTVTIGWVGYTYEWKVEWGNSVVPALSSALSATGNMFWTIIINLIALIFIWIAFMAGKWVSKAAGKAIEPFENMGNQIGKLGMSLPKYVPIPWTGGLSVKSMEKVPWLVQTAVENKDAKRFERSSLWQFLHADLNVSPEVTKRITDAIAKWEKVEFEKEWKNNSALLNRPNGHNTWIPEAFIKKSTEDTTFLGRVVDDPVTRAKLKEFEHKDLRNETTRKELWELMQSTFGGGNAAKPGPNSTTVEIIANGDSKYTLTGFGFHLEKKTKEEILKELNAAPEKLTWMHEDQLRKILKSELKIDEDKIAALLKKVQDEKDKKTKSSASPSATPPASS